MAAKLYVGRDVTFTLTIGTGFVIGDIVSMDFTLAMVDGSNSVTLTSGSGAVTVGVSSITVDLPKTAITVPGVYVARASFTDANSKVRGLTPEPGHFTFY